MNHIVMLQGMGNNERGWARLVSNFGRVVLIQQGFVSHVEIWEQGNRVFNGPETMVTKWRLLDELSLGSFSALQVFFRTLKYTRGRQIDVTISTNYHNSLAAMFLRLFGKTRKVVTFQTDYLPLRGSLAVRLHRRITGWLMRFVSRHADEVWVHSSRIPTGRTDGKLYVVPICINEFPSSGASRDEVAYIGFPSRDHALEIMFDICNRHKIRVNIVGESPYLQSIRHLAPPDTVFHGMTNDETRIGQILQKCFCGYAVYLDLSSNSYSYYGFPSKTFYCFASNVPVVISPVAEFTPTFEDRGVGRVVAPDPAQIEQAVLQLRSEYPKFSAAIDRFRQEWNKHVLEFHRTRLVALGCQIAGQVGD